MRTSHLNIAFWLVWLALFVFCFFNSYDDPSSIFYDQNKAYTPKFSAVRAREADAFIERILSSASSTDADADADRDPLPAASTLPDDVAALLPTERQPKLLCVGIPSVNRTSEAFLAHTLATLVDNLAPSERSALHIAVLLADRRPRAHFAFGQPWLATMADEVLVYANGSSAIQDLPADKYRPVAWDVRGPDHPRGGGRVENMRMDHSVLVETCRASGAPYFALVEDDVVTSRDWFARLGAGLVEVEKRARVEATEEEKAKDKDKEDSAPRDWVYLRLFYSELFMGWNSEEWLTYMETIFLVYAVGLVLFLEVRKRYFKGTSIGSSSHSRGAYRRVSNGSGDGSVGSGPSSSSSSVGTSSARSIHAGFLAALVFGLWIPALIALYFLAGRISVNRLLPWGGGTGSGVPGGVREMPRYGCCAQGLVFPERHLDGFQRLLRDPPYDFAGDQILEGWADRQSLSKWALEPSVMQHVGLKQSSEGPRRAEVWNFSFERQSRSKRR